MRCTAWEQPIRRWATAARSSTTTTASGSLTTPPCFRKVRWLVMKQPVQVSQAQIGMPFQSRDAPLPNNRPVQP